jgi:hypothetical protein
MNWTCLNRFVEIKSPWLTLIGEKWQDDQQATLEYWRVEKANSLIILPIQKGNVALSPLSQDCLLLPKPFYRPGLGITTLDFPGGRLLPEQQPETLIPQILQRELGISPEQITELSVINAQGWAVNSSFSNQKLYGYVAYLSPNLIVESPLLGASYAVSQTAIAELLTQLHCLQCRALLLEWCYINALTEILNRLTPDS